MFLFKSKQERRMVKKIEECSSKYNKLSEELLQLSEDINYETDSNKREKMAKDINMLESQLNALVENEYSKAVFDYYVLTTPDLLENKTNNLVKWDDVFGKDYCSLSFKLKEFLVALVEGGCMYRLKK